MILTAPSSILGEFKIANIFTRFYMSMMFRDTVKMIATFSEQQTVIGKGIF